MLYHNHIASTTDKTLGLCPYSSFMKINQHSCRNRFFFMSSTVLQVSKDSQIQCLFSGAAAFIGEGIDFTHTHVGHWKAMSCEECQENFRFERYIRFFFRTMVSLFTRTMWYRRGFSEKSVLNDIYTHSVFARDHVSHTSWLIHCYTDILQWDIASNYYCCWWL